MEGEKNYGKNQTDDRHTKMCSPVGGDDIADGSIVVFVWGKSTCVGRG